MLFRYFLSLKRENLTNLRQTALQLTFYTRAAPVISSVFSPIDKFLSKIFGRKRILCRLEILLVGIGKILFCSSITPYLALNKQIWKLCDNLLFIAAGQIHCKFRPLVLYFGLYTCHMSSGIPYVYPYQTHFFKCFFFLRIFQSHKIVQKYFENI